MRSIYCVSEFSGGLRLLEHPVREVLEDGKLRVDITRIDHPVHVSHESEIINQEVVDLNYPIGRPYYSTPFEAWSEALATYKNHAKQAEEALNTTLNQVSVCERAIHAIETAKAKTNEC